MEQVLDTLSYVKKFQGETILIKVGGEIVENPDGLKYLVNDIALLQSLGIYVVILLSFSPCFFRFSAISSKSPGFKLIAAAIHAA